MTNFISVLLQCYYSCATLGGASRCAEAKSASRAMHDATEGSMRARLVIFKARGKLPLYFHRRSFCNNHKGRARVGIVIIGRRDDIDESDHIASCDDEKIKLYIRKSIIFMLSYPINLPRTCYHPTRPSSCYHRSRPSRQNHCSVIPSLSCP